MYQMNKQREQSGTNKVGCENRGRRIVRDITYIHDFSLEKATACCM